MANSVQALMQRRRDAILAAWQEQTLGTYPKDSQRFFNAASNRFANPVGQTIKTGLEQLYDGLATGRSIEELTDAIDTLVRLRAVQDFTPAEAVRFLLFLPDCVSTAARESDSNDVSVEDLHWLRVAVDDILLTAVNAYVDCREHIYRIRANEARARAGKLIERANMIIDKNSLGQKIDMTIIDSCDRQGGDRQ